MTDRTSRRLILIVEDNDKNMKLMRDLLRFHGYRTAEARTAEQGIAICIRDQPDLVLMDVRLPGMDGLAALQVLRADPRTAGLRIVAVTASVMPDERDRFSAAGFDGFMAKPIDIRAFHLQIEAYLEPGPAA